MKEHSWALITWGSLERRTRSGHSGEVRPRCQSSSGRTEGSSGTMAPRSCRERRSPLESGSSDPSKPWKTQQGRRKQRRGWTERDEERQMKKLKGEKHGWLRQEKRVLFNTTCLSYNTIHIITFSEMPACVLLAGLHSGLRVCISNSLLDALNQNCHVPARKRYIGTKGALVH